MEMDYFSANFPVLHIGFEAAAPFYPKIEISRGKIFNNFH